MPDLFTIFNVPNTFGTWADAGFHNICELGQFDVAWKMVGTDSSLLPLQSKSFKFNRREVGARERPTHYNS